MINIKENEQCCGCAACAQICPKNAIQMCSDKQGFLYPKVNIGKCIHCSLCEQRCPILNVKKEKEFEQHAFLIQHKNPQILAESSSGGAFTAIASTVLKQHGVVFGAAYNKKMMVCHIAVEQETDLNKLRNSKYVQSDINKSFEIAKKYLHEGRKVCFSGTPCQIEGLYQYLGERPENLVTVDVVCHAVSSPRVWQTYLNILQRRLLNKRITNIRFRDKEKYGYLYSQMAIYGEENTYPLISEGIEENIMLRAFFSEICNRPSCYSCHFKKRYRISDFTIWDCFDLEQCKHSKRFSQNKGVSRMLVHTAKGMEMISEIQKQCILEEIDSEQLLRFDVKEMIDSVEKNQKYDKFWNDFYKNPEKTLLQYFKITPSVRAERYLRRIMFRTGLYSFVRSTYKKFFGNRKR